MEMLGWCVIAAGGADVAVAFLLVGPRMPDPSQRRIVTAALVSGGLIMVLVGLALVTGVIADESRAA